MAQENNELTGRGSQTSQVVQWLALAGFTGPILFWVVVFVLGFLTPGYSYVSNYISRLGAVHAPYAIVQQVNFVVLGVAILAGVAGFDRWNRGGWRHLIGVILLSAVGIGTISLAVFQADMIQPESTTNQYHTFLAYVAFGSAILGVPLMSWRLNKSDRWPGQGHWVTVLTTAVLMVGAFAIFLLSRGTWWVGLGQRIFVGTLSVWMAYHSFKLYRVATGSQEA